MLFSTARPILMGKLERARRVTDELEPHRAEYEALNARYGVRQHAMWVSHHPVAGDIYVALYDIDPAGLRAMRERSWDPHGSAYDRWWLEWVEDVLGFDLRSGSGFTAPPEPIFDWRSARDEDGVG